MESVQFKAVGKRIGTTKLVVTIGEKRYVSKDFYAGCDLMYDYMPHDVETLEVVSKQRGSLELRVYLIDGREFKCSAHLKRERTVEKIGSRQGGGVRSYRRQFAVA